MKLYQSYDVEFAERHLAVMKAFLPDITRDMGQIEGACEESMVYMPCYLGRGQDQIWRANLTVYPNTDVVERQRALRGRLSAYYGIDRWKRIFSESTGQFSWEAEATFTYPDIGAVVVCTINIQCATMAECKVTIKEETVTRKVFVTDCKNMEEEADL